MIGLKGLALVPLLLAAGCAAVGPDYERPPIAMAPAFVGGNSAAVTDLANRAWWTDYRDPMLNDIIRRGLAQNLSAKGAQAAIERAEANLRATGVNEALSGSASGARQRAGGSQVETGYRTTSSLSADIVIDMFGGVRRSQEAASADLDAARDDAQTQRLAWLAEVIAAYSNARYYQQALSLARESVRSREGTYSITDNKFQAGASTEYDVAEAQALLDTARAEIPNYQAQFNANVFALATLLNEPAAPLMAAMQRGSAPLRTPGTVATGVPADLLRTRPDVRAAEADLHAATAQIGVATANMLPSITLSGVVSNSGSARTWSYGPAVNLPLLNQGALWANRDAEIAAAKSAEVTWRTAVADAVEDVQVAQSNLAQYRARRAALDTAANSYSRAFNLARENYNNGALDLLDLQTTDRSRYTAQISAASAANDAAQEWARLQIATGAGALVQ